ncbi:ABC transporter permease [Anaerorhabdus sp.]|uniref:ABC transporter permease n=1 Tax=Anaerorhabdus sp. TaxID=1872524 RepID=UPI002B20B922|nr:ABC transporter permease [Anaerorhabdus sp.]MEA4875087.1 ABC transporter permease [Anaerorhabdus sp.]
MVKLIEMIKVELLTKFRYKIEIFSQSIDSIFMIFPAFAIILFSDYPASFGFSSKYEYLVFILFSLVLWGFIENMWSSVFTIRRKFKEGTLEYNMTLPLKNYHYILGWSINGLCSTIFELIPLICVSSFFIFQYLTLDKLLVMSIFLVVMIVASYGFCLVLVGLGLYFKEADQICSLLANIAPFLCGLFFPLAAMPKVFVGLSVVFPFTWGIDVLRSILFSTPTFIDFSLEIFLFITISFFYYCFGNWFFNKMKRKAMCDSLNKF